MFKSSQGIQSLEVRGAGLFFCKDVHRLELQFLDAIRGQGPFGGTLTDRTCW